MFLDNSNWIDLKSPQKNDEEEKEETEPMSMMIMKLWEHPNWWLSSFVGKRLTSNEKHNNFDWTLTITIIYASRHCIGDSINEPINKFDFYRCNGPPNNCSWEPTNAFARQQPEGKSHEKKSKYNNAQFDEAMQEAKERENLCVKRNWIFIVWHLLVVAVTVQNIESNILACSKFKCLAFFTLTLYTQKNAP